MRKIINSTYVTLDGVVENPHLWPALPLGNSDESESIQTELLSTCDIVLMGRRTYDVFAPAWSARGGDPYADRINSMRKVVASTTLTDPKWHNTEVVTDGLADRLRTLKAETGGHIVQYGFGQVSHLLMEQGLLDELHLWIYPQFVEAATSDLLFHPGLVAAFTLEGSRMLSNGIVLLSYTTTDAIS